MAISEKGRQTALRLLFIGLLAASAFVSPALALLLGIVMTLTLGNPFPAFSKKASKIALQASVVGLGFGMNLFESLESGKEGMMFTIVSVVGVMLLGVLIGRLLKVDRKKRLSHCQRHRHMRWQRNRSRGTCNRCGR